MSFQQQLEKLLNTILPRPGEVDGMTDELHEAVIETALTSIINLVDKEVIGENEIEDWKEQPEGVDMSYDFAVCRRAGRNALRAELRNKLLKGEGVEGWVS